MKEADKMRRGGFIQISGSQLEELSNEAEKTKDYQKWVRREMRRRRGDCDFGTINGTTYTLQRMCGTDRDPWYAGVHRLVSYVAEELSDICWRIKYQYNRRK